MRDGLYLAWNWGYRQIICETDCKDLVDDLGHAEGLVSFSKAQKKYFENSLSFSY